jgi:alkyl sulfatase BDS1-like metallo-beta-lactamase superfamily hydrolase
MRDFSTSMIRFPSRISTKRRVVAHFHPDGKEPSSFTRAFQANQRESLPFADERDFEEHRRGFVAAPDYTQIMADAGNVAWDMGRYDFLLQGEDFDSIHPSLQRQTTLNMGYGLYKVLPGIWQVRGFDLSNVTFIQGETGWIIFDTATVSGLGTAQRNLSAALLIATTSFASEEEAFVMVMLASVVMLLILLPLAAELGRREEQSTHL